MSHSSGAPTLQVGRLMLWRHGRTEWNATGRFQGRLDPPLDAVGRRQALEASPHLVAAGGLGPDTIVVSSDLSRAAETAGALGALLGVGVRLDPRLQEHGMGNWEGLTRAEVADRYPDQYADWLAGRPVRGRGGEESEEVAERALAALADIPAAPTAVVVTHGGTSGRLIEKLLGLGTDQRRLFGPLGNCAWSELVEQSGAWRLMKHNVSALHASSERSAGDGSGVLREGVRGAVGAREGATDRAAANAGDGDDGPIGDADAVV